MDWVEIGRGCKIRNTIIDKSNVIPSGTQIGYDAEQDKQNYFISETGIAVVARGERKNNWIMTNP
jgi:glucose-1-phosphate adenylyltransferase